MENAGTSSIARSVVIATCVVISISGLGCRSPEQDWKLTGEKNSIEAYEAYLRDYPDSQFSTEARRRLEALEWQQAESTDRKELYEQFRSNYPQSRFLENVKAKMAVIDWNEAQTAGTVDSYQRILENHPDDGAIALAAKASIDMAGQFEVGIVKIETDTTTTEVVLDVRARSSNVRAIMSPLTMQAQLATGQWSSATMFSDLKTENVEDEDVFVMLVVAKDLTRWTSFDEVTESNGKRRPDSSILRTFKQNASVRQTLAFRTITPLIAVRAYGHTVTLKK